MHDRSAAFGGSPMLSQREFFFSQFVFNNLFFFLSFLDAGLERVPVRLGVSAPPTYRRAGGFVGNENEPPE